MQDAPPPSSPTPAQQEAERRLWFVFAGVLALLLYFTREAVFTFVLAFFISYFLNPVVLRLVSWRVPRPVAVLLVFLVFGGLLFLVLELTVPPLVVQGERFAKFMADYLNQLPEQLAQWESQARESPRMQSLLKYVNRDGHFPSEQEMVELIKPYLSTVGKGAASASSKVLGTLPYLMLAPILIAYLLVDFDRLKTAFWVMVPKRHHQDVRTIGRYMEESTLNYLKGYIKLAAFMGVSVAIAMAVMGVPYALLFGVIAFFMEFLPYVGPLVMALPPIIVAATSGGPWLAVVIFFFVLQILEGQVLAPRIVGQEAGLHPLMIIFALLVGGQLAGIVGMLVSIPLMSFCKQLVKHYMEQHHILAAEEQDKAPPSPAPGG